MAIVLLWDFQKRTAPNPLRAAWESGVDRTTDPWTKATVKSFTSKVKLILKGIQQHRQKNPTFSCTVQCHLQGKVAVDQRKLILITLMPSEKAKALAARSPHLITCSLSTDCPGWESLEHSTCSGACYSHLVVTSPVSGLVLHRVREYEDPMET